MNDATSDGLGCVGRSVDCGAGGAEVTWWVGLGNPGRQAAFLSGVRARQCTRKKEQGGLCRLKDQHARVRGDAASWQSPLPGGPAWVTPSSAASAAPGRCAFCRETRGHRFCCSRHGRAGLAGGAAASERGYFREGVSTRKTCGMRGRSPSPELWVTGRCQGEHKQRNSWERLLRQQ